MRNRGSRHGPSCYHEPISTASPLPKEPHPCCTVPCALALRPLPLPLPGPRPAWGRLPGRRACHVAQGGQGLQGRTALLRAEGRSKARGSACASTPRAGSSSPTSTAALYRITPPALGGKAGRRRRSRSSPIALGEAQGLLWAFDSLYVVVNGAGKFKSGLYRVPLQGRRRHFEKVEIAPRSSTAAASTAPHAVLLAPGRQVAHRRLRQPDEADEPLAASRVPRLWGEDHLLPRMPDGNGFMAGVLGAGRLHLQRRPRRQEVGARLSTGFRNQYDAAFNRHGELFTYDADMEWDINTPWYRPTRVCLVTSGSEFGWRNGAGKWPAYYPDSLPAVVDVGPGSPTGVTFGYGAKFPAKYQEALFMCDWSYGKLYAVHLTPHRQRLQGRAGRVRQRHARCR